MTAFVLHLGEQKTRFSDRNGKPYTRPRHHHPVRVGRDCVLEGFAVCPVVEVAKSLLGRKIATPSQTIEVRRGSTPVFAPCRIDHWAALTVEENDTRSASFRPYKARAIA